MLFSCCAYIPHISYIVDTGKQIWKPHPCYWDGPMEKEDRYTRVVGHWVTQAPGRAHLDSSGATSLCFLTLDSHPHIHHALKPKQLGPGHTTALRILLAASKLHYQLQYLNAGPSLCSLFLHPSFWLSILVLCPPCSPVSQQYPTVFHLERLGPCFPFSP